MEHPRGVDPGQSGKGATLERWLTAVGTQGVLAGVGLLCVVRTLSTLGHAQVACLHRGEESEYLSS